MSETISRVILQLLIPILIGFVLFIVEYRILSRRSGKTGSKATTTGDLARLVNGLNKSSNELDNILTEIIQVAQHRGEATAKLQAEISKLEQTEEEYLVRIETLKNEPVRVISDLLNELSPRQIRSPRRDFVLFIAGVVVSAIVSIVLGLLRLGG
jgi:tetrahydromethanopterin S-methyltransferase subunit B